MCNASGRSLGKLGVVVALVVMLGAGLWLARGPDFVNRVSVTNRTGYDLNVDVTGADHDGWLPISVATGGGSTTATQDVIDQARHVGLPVLVRGQETRVRSRSHVRCSRRTAGASWCPTQVAKNLGDAGILPGP